MMSQFPFLGFGLGFRPHYYDEIFDPSSRARVDWYEAVTENFLAWEDGVFRRPLARLEKIRATHPVVLHGVSLSLGSADPLNESYLDRLDALVRRIEPAWVSDHLCWTGVGGTNAHDLLPLPYSREAAARLAGKIGRVQDRLKRRILVENVSSYVEFAASEMTEWEFIAEIVQRSGCGLLLDVNNIFVSARNHGFDPNLYLEGIPLGAPGQIHMAGHRDKGAYLVDTHDRPIREEVWSLYRAAVARFGAVSAMIEWDDDYPEWTYLLDELDRLRKETDGRLIEAAAAGLSRPAPGAGMPLGRRGGRYPERPAGAAPHAP